MKIDIQDGDKPQEKTGLDKKADTEDAFAELAEEGQPAMKKSRKGKLEKKQLPKKKKNEINQLKEMVKNLTEKLEKREEEIVEAQDKAVRAVADADNFKKRIARESDEQTKYATSSIIEAILPALDNLDKACKAAEGDSAGSVDQLRDGVNLVYQQFHDILKRNGLEKLEVVGKPFDPGSSEALQMEETGEFEDGIVIREYAAGYKLKERVIRPAQVVVAKNESSG